MLRSGNRSEGASVQRQREESLAGKVALVTGASRGIGRHTALKLAERGVNLVLAARSVEDGALPGTIGETAARAQALGVEALPVATDMAQEEDLQQLVRAAEERFGGVDILINNAAVTSLDTWSSPLLDIPRADWEYQFAVNIHAPFTLTQLVVPSMEVRGGGRILNVTAGCAEVYRQPEEPPFREAIGDFRMAAPAYLASKRGLDRFGNVVAPELARKNIAIIGVMPGLTASEITVRNVETAGLDGSKLVSMDIPARLISYFAACEAPLEYTGRLFLAERELEAMAIEP